MMLRQRPNVSPTSFQSHRNLNWTYLSTLIKTFIVTPPHQHTEHETAVTSLWEMQRCSCGISFLSLSLPRRRRTVPLQTRISGSFRAITTPRTCSLPEHEFSGANNTKIYQTFLDFQFSWLFAVLYQYRYPALLFRKIVSSHFHFDVP